MIAGAFDHGDRAGVAHGEAFAGDAERLRALITRHKSFTGSSVAEKILANWAAYLPKFKKVMPVEYRRALAELEKEQARLQIAAE